jgi:acyl-CoA dehydrogenase
VPKDEGAAPVLDDRGLLHDPDAYATALNAWMESNAGELAPFCARNPGSIEDAFAHEARFLALLADGGWSRYGWPEDVGGLGGSAILRGVLYDELTRAGYVIPEAYLFFEVLAPTLVTYAPRLAASEFGPCLRGDVVWCQGFSEPDAGSDLASLRTRAVEDGDGFRVNGQKVWASFGTVAQRSAVLVRTGSPESRHRGLSMLWIDLATPGVTVRPISAETGRNEFAELFFDDVVVPRDHLIGELNGGWAVAMYLLQFERGMYAWQRQSWMHTRLEQAMAEAVRLDGTESLIGGAYLALLALRLKCRDTVLRLAREENPGPGISVDKLLLSGAEQKILDTARTLLWPRLEFDDSDAAQVWRSEWLFARAASIYGGAAEVQRDIVAERLVGLGRARGDGR